MKYLFACAAFFLLGASPTLSAPCLKTDTEIEISGTTRAVAYSDAAGRPLSGMLLDLENPECVSGREGEVRFVQLFDATRFETGRTIRLRGTLSEIPTAHWYTDLVFEAAP